MSAIAEDVFSNDAYQAPKAQLIDNNQDATPDKLMSHHGRIGVLAFNARMLMAMGIMIVVSLVMAVVVGFGQGSEVSAQEGSSNWPIILAVVLFIPAFYLFMRLSIVSTIKRLHDLGLNGWHYFQMIIPIYGTLFFLYISLKPASVDANQFGAHRSVSGKEKIAGIVGLVFMVSVMVASVVANVYSIAEVVGS